MNPTEPPVWLGQEAEITALLHAVLDRFDRQPGGLRTIRVYIGAERYLPSLSRADAQADQTWALVRELERFGLMAIRSSRRNPYDPEWKGARLGFAPDSEVTLRTWLERQRVEPAMQLWRRAVQDRAHAFPGDPELLLRRRVAIPGRTAEAVVAAFASMAAVSRPVTLRQLSARSFWGDSKILDDRVDLVTGLFPNLEISARSMPVNVFLPETYAGVLFIENQDTYAAATAGQPVECRSFALVYASGFRSSGARVRSREGVLLHYAGPGAESLKLRFERWWFDCAAAAGPVWFWGDLDFAGMQILKSLRSRFESLDAWRAGYEPMVAALRAGGGHGQAVSEDPEQGDSGQVDPGLIGCPFADTILLPAIREHGRFDQEAILQ